MLTEMEGELLAMCEEDFITISLAKKVLSFWYGKHISKKCIISMLYRLAKLKLIRWNYKDGCKHYISNSLRYAIIGNKDLTFKATNSGLIYLQE